MSVLCLLITSQHLLCSRFFFPQPVIVSASLFTVETKMSRYQTYTASLLRGSAIKAHCILIYQSDLFEEKKVKSGYSVQDFCLMKYLKRAKEGGLKPDEWICTVDWRRWDCINMRTLFWWIYISGRFRCCIEYLNIINIHLFHEAYAGVKLTFQRKYQALCYL